MSDDLTKFTIEELVRYAVQADYAIDYQYNRNNFAASDAAANDFESAYAEARRRDAAHAALVDAAEYTLEMMARIYPESSFTGVSGDIGVLMIVESRKKLKAALEAARGE